MAQTNRRSDIDEQSLIERYIDPNWDRYGGRADARTVEGVPIWALVNHLRLVDGDVSNAADAYGLSCEAVEAALAYYRRNKKYIDARIFIEYRVIARWLPSISTATSRYTWRRSSRRPATT